jgi:hypothetical protein
MRTYERPTLTRAGNFTKATASAQRPRTSRAGISRSDWATCRPSPDQLSVPLAASRASRVRRQRGFRAPSGTAVPWFGLPDAESAVRSSLRSGTGERARPRCRPPQRPPWIVAIGRRTPSSWLRVGATALALVGQHRTTADQLTAAAARSGGRPTSNSARSLVGSIHLIASVDGQVRVQGTSPGYAESLRRGGRRPGRRRPRGRPRPPCRHRPRRAATRAHTYSFRTSSTRSRASRS